MANPLAGANARSAVGALGSAASGAATGSILGPVGAAVGGIGGALLGLFGRKNRQPKIRNQQILTPEQQQALQQYFSQGIGTNPLYQQGSSLLSNLLSGDPQAYKNFEAPYLQQFEQEIQPMITERFAGMGTGAGGLNSSALYNSLAQAGKNLQVDLAGLRSGLQMQAIPQALGYAQQPYANTLGGLGVHSFQPYDRPGQPNFFTGLSSGILGGFGQGIGQRGAEYFGNKFFE